MVSPRVVVAFQMRRSFRFVAGVARIQEDG